MQYRFLILPIVAVCLGLLFGACAGADSKTEQQSKVAPPPNVLLIVADDLGREVGCYGDTLARTPNLDRLAMMGTRFADAYVTQASCSPSRSSILTGLWPHQTGQVGLSHTGFSMDSTYDNLFSILHSAGYATGIMGKLHVEPLSAFPLDWGLGGFDTWLVPPPPDSALRVPVVDVDGSTSLRVEKFTRYDMPVMADSAAAFIARAGRQPFFLMMNFLDPHRPFRNQINGYPRQIRRPEQLSLPGWFAQDATDDALAQWAAYYNGTTRFDEGLGAVMALLDREGLWDSTLVIVLGDHGAPFDRAKTTVYEAGLRTPLVLRLPGGRQAGRSYHGMVSTIDILPTVLRELGLDSLLPPGRPGYPLQELLSGAQAPRRLNFGEFTAHTTQQILPQRCVVADGRWKLIHTPVPTPATPEYQLYDLAADPYEWNNQYGRAPDSIVTRLKDELVSWQIATDDPLREPDYLRRWAGRVTDFRSE